MKREKRTYREMWGKMISFFMYDGMEKDEYATIQGEIYEKNLRNMTIYSSVSAFLFLGLYISSYLIDSIIGNRFLYLIQFIVSFLVMCAFRTIAQNHRAAGESVKYIFEVSLLSFGIVLGAIKSPESEAAVFIVLLVIIPMMLYDVLLFSVLIRATMIIVYVVIALQTKDMGILLVDLINVVCFSILCTIEAGFSQHIQAEAFLLKHNMQKEIKAQTHLLEERANKIEKLSLQSMIAFSAAIDAKDAYTNGHSTRVAQYSKMIAEKYGKDEEQQKNIYFIALLHDVGKIGIPDQIINKPTKLSDEEYAIIKGHPAIGYNILKNIEELPAIAIGARFHHERYDGKGYPLGMAGQDIPEIARIIAVADAYDAMTSNRSYRELMPQEKVKEEIRKGKGTQFDPVFADIMLALIEADKGYCMHG